MVFKKLMRALFGVIRKAETWSSEQQKITIYREEPEETQAKTLVSLWDSLQFQENSQAYHLNSVIGFEEWVDMEEIRRRINELFGAEYKNFRSLYPYLKTLTDIGLMETSNVGGRRKWRKKEVLAQVQEERKEEKKSEKITVKTSPTKSDANEKTG